MVHLFYSEYEKKSDVTNQSGITTNVFFFIIITAYENSRLEKNYKYNIFYEIYTYHGSYGRNVVSILTSDQRKI